MIIFAKSSLTNNDSKSSNEEECVYGKDPAGEKHLRLEYDRKDTFYVYVDSIVILIESGRNHFRNILVV